jgi:hypothetical protein
MILLKYKYQTHFSKRGLLVAKSSGESIIHVNAVRIRVKGDGLLRMQMQSLDEVYTKDLVPLDLAETNNREPTQLTNFKQQRQRLYVKTTDFADYFDINRIIIFAKPMFTSFPQ